jgi:hypothetical protein
MAEPTKLSGSFSSISIGTTPTIFACKSWKATVETVELDVTSTSSGGFKEVQPGNSSCVISIDAEADSAILLSGTSLGITPGDYITDFTGKLSQASSAPTLTVPLA